MSVSGMFLKYESLTSTPTSSTVSKKKKAVFTTDGLVIGDIPMSLPSNANGYLSANVQVTSPNSYFYSTNNNGGLWLRINISHGEIESYEISNSYYISTSEAASNLPTSLTFTIRSISTTNLIFD